MIILLSGWKRSGKTTAAEYLEDNHSMTHLSIAAPLKDMVAEKYDIPRSYMDDQNRKEVPLLKYPGWSPRDILILEGNTARQVDPLFWVRQVAREMYARPAENFVIADVRYPNEIECFKEHLKEVRTVRINREAVAPSKDPSERSLDSYAFDYSIDNTGTVKDLHTALNFVVAFHADHGDRVQDGSVRVRLGDGSYVTISGPTRDKDGK